MKEIKIIKDTSLKGELICCQMIIGESNKPLRANRDFSNVKTVYVNEKTFEVYDENNQFLGIAERKFGSEIFEIKLKL